ncbi:IclR family transcriptional regulator [Ruegeria sp. 2012CJ41-6]|uniref:IclR family transcriptional regulator n=1 Tax=Ruegeria spongiae TaxID=2942209 RepID=A0ABT0Q4R1_9RHOB|nr:IclR family transcriptional regulator [Ruegeria spongiae]MCL6284843.1 IclR family transcriptional regulator [Ruegeria spongiae]
MDVLTRARHPMVFFEIVNATQFVKCSCHRILAVLQNEELVEYDKESRTYKTGQRLHRWARAAWNRSDLQQVAAVPITALSEETNMNTALIVLDHHEILYLRTSNFDAVRYAPHAGDRAPLHCTAAGKVLLAHMSEAQWQAYIQSASLEKYTEYTHTSTEALAAELPKVREAGYATAIREEFLQVMGMSIPIWNDQNKVAACLSLWTLTASFDPDSFVAHAPRLQEVARGVSNRIGGAVPT